ncbi:ATP-binding cassette domain-containing protein [Streptomyces sp. NPDC049555]|uniref:ABC transporter ATP-binding protein n=1 Tax=Streptomyces sp. NPDC049555 TaxID=3154930 RepID=UPI00342F0380
MIQAIGLTSAPRRNRPPAVDDLTFEARPGRVTALLGEPGAGKTAALRLMLRLDPGRGVTLFRGRTLDRIPRPTREIGVLLGDVPGHPARTARSHLRMLCAAAGVPAERADDVLEVVGLSGLADQRLGDFSLGMDRRLGLASALLGDPHTLVLDEPARGLSPRETAWLHGLLRGYAAQGGAVLVTSGDAVEAARIADQVVTIDQGRLVADQEAAAFAGARLRPRVVVQSPLAGRLAHVLTAGTDTGDRRSGTATVEVIREGGTRIAVYGSSCAEVGETAYRNGILVHRLAEESGDTGPVAPLDRADGRPSGEEGAPAQAKASAEVQEADEAPNSADAPPPGSVRRRLTAPGPAWPLLYELRRVAGVQTGWVVAAVALAVSVAASLLLARTGAATVPRLLTGWPQWLPLPPAACAAGLLGANAFGQEFRYPALAPDQGTVPRRLGLLGAKLLVASVASLALALLVPTFDLAVVHLALGEFPHPATLLTHGWGAALAGWIALVVGCGWAGLLAAGLFRSTALGLVSVLAVPAVVVPLLGALARRPAARSLMGLSERLRDAADARWPHELGQGVSAALHLVSQPVGWALTLSLSGLLAAYVLTVFRGRPR